MTAEIFHQQLRKTTLEYIVLKIIAQQAVYVSDIVESLNKLKVDIAEGTLYPMLTRLKNSEMLAYEWQESTQGPPRKYYKLTKAGNQLLAEYEREWREVSKTIAKISQPKSDKQKLIEQDVFDD